MPGARGIEPLYGGVKIHRLSTWLCSMCRTKVPFFFTRYIELKRALLPTFFLEVYTESEEGHVFREGLPLEIEGEELRLKQLFDNFHLIGEFFSLSGQELL